MKPVPKLGAWGAILIAVGAIACAALTSCSQEKPSYPRIWTVTPSVLGLSAVREVAPESYEVQTVEGWKPVLRTDSGTNYFMSACQVTFWKVPVGMWTFDKDKDGFLHYPGARVDGPPL